MPRFVILIHDHPFPHWDFLLENGATCRTWRLRNDPALLSAGILAEALPDHRLMYLEYEGPVSGERGTVIRWDSGTFQWRRNETETCEVDITGKIWRGVVHLHQLQGTAWNVSRIP